MVISELSLGEIGHQAKEAPAIGSYVTPVYKMTEPQFSVHMVAQEPLFAADCRVPLRGTCRRPSQSRGWIFDLLDPIRGDSRPVSGPFCQFAFLSDPAAAAVRWPVTVEGGNAL